MLLGVNATAAVFYAATNGVSSGSGTTPATAWDLTYACAHAGPSNTIILLDGGPYPAIDLDTPSLHNGLTIVAQHKWKAFISGVSQGYTTEIGVWGIIDGVHFVYATNYDVRLSGSGIVQNCWIANSGRPPGWVTNGTGTGASGIIVSRFAVTNFPPLIQYCLIESNGSLIIGGGGQDHGIYQSSSGAIVRGCVIRYNLGYGCQMTSSFLDTIVTGTQFYNNLVYGNGDKLDPTRLRNSCFVVNANEGNNTVTNGTNWVYGNILINNGNYPVVPCYNGTVYFTNNIIIGGNGGGYLGNVDIVSGVGFVDYNIATNSFSGSGAVDGGHNINTNYFGFENITNGLYWLLANSPARNRAFTQPLRGGPILGIEGPVDFFGKVQNSDQNQSVMHDIGAFAYSATQSVDMRVLDPSPSYGADYWSYYLPAPSLRMLGSVKLKGSVKIGKAQASN